MLSWASIAATTAGGMPLGRRLGSHAARVIRVTRKADLRCEEDQGGAVGLTDALI